MKKLLSFFLAFLLLITALSATACSNEKKLNKTVVGTVGGYEVYYEELRWLTLQYKDLYEASYGEGIWDDGETAEKYRADLENSVYTAILANYAVLTLCDDPSLTLNGEKLIDINSASVQELVDNFINETIDEVGGERNYKKNLKESYLTDDLYRFITGIDICENLLFKQYCELMLIDDSNEAAYEYITENFIRTKHIYIQNDAKDNAAENRALAESIRIKLMNGEDLDTLIDNYSEDGYMSADGYYFTRGQYSKAYENASFALGVGEISEVVETFSGYYVIQRLEPDNEYIMRNLLLGLKDQYLLAVFDKYIEDCKATLTFIPNEFGSELDLTEMK